MPGERHPNIDLQFLLLVFTGWVNRHQQSVIKYLQAEKQLLRVASHGAGAWGAQNRVVIKHVKGDEKSKEIAAI